MARLYHASPIEGIRVLEPRVSNHDVSRVYFSEKRENVLVYLSNAIEKYCRETGFSYNGIWQKWGPYGFDKDGVIRLEEYYPNALKETYEGVRGYIYSVKTTEDMEVLQGVPYAFVTEKEVPVMECEIIPDAYEAILKAEKENLLRIIRYEKMPDEMQEWLKKAIHEEYQKSEAHPEYRYFLKAKFDDSMINGEL